MIPEQPPLTHPLHLLFFIFLFSTSFIFSHQHTICDHQDQSDLLAFSTNISVSPPWAPLNWTSGLSCCQWEGVQCNLNGRVTHLQLPSRSLRGPFFISSITNLHMLTHLNLSKNYLHGFLGDHLSQLKSLKTMDLSANTINGSIPHGIGELLHLENLHLYQNNLTGSIPPSLMNCTSIVEIILGDNLLNGDISKLDFSNLVHLQKLDLKTNLLNGTLPQSIYSCKSLIALRIAHNNISGQISPKIVKLRSLSFLSLAENHLTNITMALKILAKCKNLTTLSLSSNFHGESLPTHRNFIGLGKFPKLQFFYLQKCSSHPGPIPNWLSSLKSLHALNIGNNQFSGPIPKWLGNLPKLFSLGLSNNSLHGEVPAEVWELPGLITQTHQFSLSDQFELPIFLPIGPKLNSIRYKANYYHGLFLSNNSLQGHIPENIGLLRNLQMMYLDGNHFSGHIPASLSDLHKLERLDLSKNQLIGEIPSSLTTLTFMSYFDVSYNDLEGPIPSGGQFGSFADTDFEGNPGLCGKPLNQPCYSATPALNPMDGDESGDSKNQFLNGVFVGFAFGFTVILVAIGSYVWYHNSI